MSIINSFIVSAESPQAALHSSISMENASLLLPPFVDLRPFGLNYAVAKFLISNAVYESYLGLVSRKKLLYGNDKRFGASTHPAVGVNFRDALEYCEWMSNRFSAKFELPDSMTWEKIACCNKGKNYSTLTGDCTSEYANFGLLIGGTTPVNKYPPNEFGIHDMTGNVLEWTSSVPSVTEMRPEYGAMPVKNDRDLAQNRILKGGSWAFDAANSRISATIIMGVFSNYYTTGFRPVIRLE